MPQNKAINDLQKIVSLYQEGAVFVAVDTETTGSKPNVNRIMEIGAVKFSCNGLIEKFGTLINPQTSIDPFIVNITHITEEMVKDAPDAKDVLPDFLRFANGCILIAHNVPFDTKFINAEFKRIHYPEMKNFTIDTVTLSRKTFPDILSHKLQYLAEYFGIEVEAAHRAYDDAYVCMKVFIKCVEQAKVIIKELQEKKNYAEEIKKINCQNMANMVLDL